MSSSPGGGRDIMSGSSRKNFDTRFFTGMPGSKRRRAAAGPGPAVSPKTGRFFAGTCGSRPVIRVETESQSHTFKGTSSRFAFAATASRISRARFFGDLGEGGTADMPTTLGVVP